MRFIGVFRVGSSPTTGRNRRNRMVDMKTRKTCQLCGLFVSLEVCDMTRKCDINTTFVHHGMTKR